MRGYSSSAVTSSFGGIVERFRFPFPFVGVPAAVVRDSSIYKCGLVVFDGAAYCGWEWMDDSGVNGSMNVWGVDCAVRYITRKFLLYNDFHAIGRSFLLDDDEA